MEYDHRPAGHSIRKRSKDSRNHVEYHRAINGKDLGDCHKVRAQARDTYARDLCLSQQTRYAHAYLLAKIWYTAQMFPVPMTCTRQLNTAIAWYTWKGAIITIINITQTQETRRLGFD